MVVVRRPVHLAPARRTEDVDLEPESVGEREIDAGVAAKMSVTAFLCER